MVARPVVRVETADFDVAAEIERVHGGDPSVGAVASFVGYCRSEDGRLAALELEHYPGMAEAEIARVAGEAVVRFNLSAATVIHRYGRLAPGARIVLVVTASSHRADAFASCEYLMDYLKTRAPFWKKEIPADGSTGGWVASKAEDEARTERWKA